MNTQPAIRILAGDFERLSRLADAAPGMSEAAAAFLRHELDRAAIAPDTERDTVQMGSRVRFRDHGGRIHDVRLVYPAQSDPQRGFVSVLTPVGSALLGLRTGATMQWPDRDGRPKQLTVLSVHPATEEVLS